MVIIKTKQKTSISSKISNILDADIRATLNSYQYLKRLLSERLEKQAPTMVFVCLGFHSMIESFFFE